MSSYNYKPGLGNVGSYQVAGAPYVSGGIDSTVTSRLSFPNVTSWITITNNTATACKVGFSALGLAGNNYITVPSASMSPRLEVKVTEIYLAGSTDVDICAGLTGIDLISVNNTAVSPSGSNWSGSLRALVG
tara:strand:- start:503 stop:898 length:396 start_codon:yes stop_codon:yes gene_type:complete